MVCHNLMHVLFTYEGVSYTAFFIPPVTFVRVDLHVNASPSVNEVDHGTSHGVLGCFVNRASGLVCRGQNKKKDEVVVLIQHCHVVVQRHHIKTENMPVNGFNASGHCYSLGFF